MTTEPPTVPEAGPQPVEGSRPTLDNVAGVRNNDGMNISCICGHGVTDHPLDRHQESLGCEKCLCLGWNASDQTIVHPTAMTPERVEHLRSLLR